MGFSFSYQTTMACFGCTQKAQAPFAHPGSNPRCCILIHFIFFLTFTPLLVAETRAGNTHLSWNCSFLLLHRHKPLQMRSSLEMQTKQLNPSCKQNCKSAPVFHLVFGKIFFMIPSRDCFEQQFHADQGLSLWHNGCSMKAASHKHVKTRWATEMLKMHQGMQERSWSHRSGKKNDGGRHISANLINAPAPVNSKAKRFLTAETTWLRTKEEPGKLRINLGILQCGRNSPLPSYCWMIIGTGRTDR